jgi:hypothetical protein
MTHALKMSGAFLVARWRRWLPPLIVVGIVVMALAQFTPHEVNQTFHYKLF